MDEVGEGTHPPLEPRDQYDAVSQLNRVTCELREDLEHERGKHMDVLGNVNRLSSDKEKDMAEYAFA
uniref:Uncharacterized protein n=1 Tax=Hyaloperonospora arabidopsidis (strain Emoy2) TaxID=559515 RepID=M4BSZ5_HYAAE